MHASYIDAEEPATILPTLVEGYVVCRRGTMERRVISAVLGSCRHDRTIHAMLKRYGEHGKISPGEDNDGATSDVVAPLSTRRSRDGRMGSEGARNCPASPASTTEKVLSDTMLTDVQRGLGRKRRKVSGCLLTTMSHGRTYWSTVLALGTIPRRNFTRKRGDDLKIRHVIGYIFQPHVTQLLAWGSIRFRVGR